MRTGLFIHRRWRPPPARGDASAALAADATVGCRRCGTCSAACRQPTELAIDRHTAQAPPQGDARQGAVVAVRFFPRPTITQSTRESSLVSFVSLVSLLAQSTNIRAVIALKHASSSSTVDARPAPLIVSSGHFCACRNCYQIWSTRCSVAAPCRLQSAGRSAYCDASDACVWPAVVAHASARWRGARRGSSRWLYVRRR